jgi:hypothetical protein
MKNKLRILPAIVLLMSGLAFSAVAQTGDPVTETATATATIITPLTLTNAGDMNFGNITATSAGGTVVLAPAGTRLATGVQLPGTSASVSAASFAVEGEAGYAYTVTLPTGTHTLTETVGGTATMLVGTFTSNAGSTPSLDVDGAGSFSVGATLTIGANQLSGTYTNALGFTVAVAYN